jgi:hypothetical protein
MLIDASNYPSVRAAIRETMATALTGPHTSLVIDGIINPDMSVRHLQIAVAQVTPADWKLFTERDGETLTLYRWT